MTASQGPTSKGTIHLLNEMQRTEKSELPTGAPKETLRMFPAGFAAKMDDKSRDKYVDLNGQALSNVGKRTLGSQVNHTSQHAAANHPSPVKFELVRLVYASP